jgi:hypothetical protein
MSISERLDGTLALPTDGCTGTRLYGSTAVRLNGDGA